MVASTAKRLTGVCILFLPRSAAEAEASACPAVASASDKTAPCFLQTKSGHTDGKEFDYLKKERKVDEDPVPNGVGYWLAALENPAPKGFRYWLAALDMDDKDHRPCVEGQRHSLNYWLAHTLAPGVAAGAFLMAFAGLTYLLDNKIISRGKGEADMALFVVRSIQFLGVLGSTTMLLDSHALIRALGGSAATSGLYLGLYNIGWGVIANFFVFLCMRVSAIFWRTGCKALLCGAVVCQLVGMLTYAVITVCIDCHKGSPFWLLLAMMSRLLMGFGAGVVNYVWRHLIVHLVDVESRPSVCMQIPLVSMVANGLGPLVVLVAQASTSWAWDDKSRVFACDGVLQLLFFTAILFLVASFPSLTSAQDHAAAIVDIGEERTMAPEPSARRTFVIFGCVVFGMLWGFVFGGLDVAMVMIVEDEFQFGIKTTCFLVSLTFLAIIPVRGFFDNANLPVASRIRIFMGLSLVGSSLLFRFLWRTLSTIPAIGVALIMVGDMLMLPCFSLSWGLCDGIAVQHAPQHGWFGSANVIMASGMTFSLFRLPGAVSSRLLIASTGRDAYALQQMIATLAAWLLASWLILPFRRKSASFF